jgi:hypothetical protein
LEVFVDDVEIIGEVPLSQWLGGLRGEWRTIENDRQYIDQVEGPGATDAYVYDLQAKRRIARDAFLNKDFRMVASVPLSIGLDLERRRPGWVTDQRFLRSEIMPRFGVTPRRSTRSFSGVGVALNSKPSISTS